MKHCEENKRLKTLNVQLKQDVADAATTQNALHQKIADKDKELAALSQAQGGLQILVREATLFELLVYFRAGNFVDATKVRECMFPSVICFVLNGSMLNLFTEWRA